jgi:hypothetical protein
MQGGYICSGYFQSAGGEDGPGLKAPILCFGFFAGLNPCANPKKQKQKQKQPQKQKQRKK